MESLQHWFNRPVPVLWALPILILAFLFFWGWYSSGIIIKQDRYPLEFNPRTFGREFETFTAQTADGVSLDGWFVPAQKPSDSSVVVLHGWGANRSDFLENTIWLSPDHNLVYFDFRNHGRSGGNQTSLTCLEGRDLDAVLDWLKKEKPAQSKRIGLFGFSMGAAVAITGAARRPEVQAVVGESPFSSFNGVVDRFARMFYHSPKFLVPVTLAFSRWRLGLNPDTCSPIHHIGTIAPRPVLLIQGGQDERMPVSEGESLFAAAGEPKELWVVPPAGHVESHSVAQKEYDLKVGAFFKKWLKN